MSNQFIDVHQFDGKLKGIFIPNQIYTIQEKHKKFSEFIPKLSDPAAIQTVQAIITDLYKPKGDNFQIENNIDASDILMHLLHLDINKPDLLNNLNEQLVDTRNLGICPSGRCTRLLQLWLAYKDETPIN